MNLLKLLCRICSLTSTDEVHFMCFLSMYVFHPDRPDFFKTCMYDKLILQTVLLAVKCQLQQLMFEHHSVFMIQCFINDMTDILDHTLDCTDVADVNIMISLFHNLVMSFNI